MAAIKLPWRITFARAIMNLRFGSRHVYCYCFYGRLVFGTSLNKGHDRQVEWWPPRVRRGEFRKRPSWRWFAAYDALRWHAKAAINE